MVLFGVPDLELHEENPRFVIPGNDGVFFSVVTLLKALVEICSDLIFQVETHDLAFEGWI